MNNLEEYVTKHCDEFSDSEPPEGHFERFESKLGESPEQHQHPIRRTNVLKMAAVILLLISVGAFAIEYGVKGIFNSIMGSPESTGLSAEMTDALNYYDNQNRTKIERLAEIAAVTSETKGVEASVLKELESLDASSVELKRSLGQNPGNERLQAALIQNQRMKESILNTVLHHISDKPF